MNVLSRDLGLILLTVSFVSCIQKNSEDAKIRGSEYFRIAMDDCPSIGPIELNSSNSRYFDLLDSAALGIFVFATDFPCGQMGGSCGQSIEVFAKMPGEYRKVYSSCGIKLMKSKNTNFGVHTFHFYKRAYPADEDELQRVEVNWNGSEFAEEYL